MGMLDKSSHKSQVASRKLKDCRVGVFRGGVSPERDISLLSGENVLRALRNKGYKAIDIDLKTKDEGEIVKIVKDNAIDRARS